MLQILIYSEDTTIMNIHAPNNNDHQYEKRIEIETLLIGHITLSLWQFEWKENKYIGRNNLINNKVDLIYSTWQPNNREYIFF